MALANQIEKLKGERKELVLAIRKTVDVAEKENRNLRADEKESTDKQEDAIKQLDERIARLERAMELDDDDKREEDGKAEKDEKEDRSVVTLPDGRQAVLIGTGKTKVPPQRNDPNTGKLLRHIGESDADFIKRERREQAGLPGGFHPLRAEW
jgi:hypothetical protein